MTDENNKTPGVLPFGGSLTIDFGGNESVTIIDLETDESSEVPLISECPN